MKNIRSAFVLTSLFSILSTPAFVAHAESPLQQMKAKALEAAKAKATDVMAACKEDTVKLCPEMKGLEKTKTCLKSNFEKLTPGCKAAVGTGS